MKEFKNLKSLFAYINKDIKKTMQTDIVEAVKDQQQIQIEEEVYGVYEPIEYMRRRDSGGLQDRDNMVATPIQKMKDGYIISVVNLTKGADNEQLYLAPLVEHGDGYAGEYYDYPTYDRNHNRWKYLKARPFTKATIDALREGGFLTEVMRQSLRDKGYEVV